MWHNAQTPFINNTSDLITHYPKQFDQIGNFKGLATLVVNEDAIPFIDPPRKCPIHIKDEIKEQLDSLEKQTVIRKVQEQRKSKRLLLFQSSHNIRLETNVLVVPTIIIKCG